MQVGESWVIFQFQFEWNTDKRKMFLPVKLINGFRVVFLLQLILNGIAGNFFEEKIIIILKKKRLYNYVC